MEQKQTDNKILQKFLRLLKWILFALFLLLALIFVSSLGNSILFLLCSLLVCPPIWDKIKNNPTRPKNIMSFPFDDPIKNRYVMGLMIGFKISLTKITPARSMNINPSSIVLLSFINNNLILIL